MKGNPMQNDIKMNCDIYPQITIDQIQTLLDTDKFQTLMDYHPKTDYRHVQAAMQRLPDLYNNINRFPNLSDIILDVIEDHRFHAESFDFITDDTNDPAYIPFLGVPVAAG
jgi:hypothetical protein